MKNIYEMLHDVEDVSEEIERVDLNNSEKKAVMKHLLQKSSRAIPLSYSPSERAL